MADEAAQLTGDLGGPPMLAAWQQAQRAEKVKSRLQGLRETRDALADN
jgi:hypothetical protein